MFIISQCEIYSHDLLSQDDGSFVISGLSIDHPAYPRIKGLIRAKVSTFECRQNT